MPSVEAVQEWQRNIRSLTVLATRDINQFWQKIALMDPAEGRAILMEIMPQVVQEYASLAADVSADFYASAGRPGFRSVSAAPPPVAQVQGAVGWATAGMGSGGATLPRLVGSTTRLIFDASRETTLLNVGRDDGAAWARYASSTACGFCRMLATRHVGDNATFYSSADAAGRVTGRQQSAMAAFNQSPRKTRGSRSIGSKYHDHCKCLAVPVRPGDSYDPPEYVHKWNEDYIEAVKRAKAEGKTRGEFGAIDPAVISKFMDEGRPHVGPS